MRLAVVTGGSRGIGKVICESLHGDYKVVSVARSNSDFNTDLSVESNCEDVIKHITLEHGSIDILINNAGTIIPTRLQKTKQLDWDTTMNTNLNSTFWMCKNVVPYMKKNRFGRIVNITSIASDIGLMTVPSYAASKGAIQSFTKSIAYELAAWGITANCIAPGLIDTDLAETLKDGIYSKLIPMGRFGKPEEVAVIAKMLVSNEASYITGSTIHVNGGLLMS